MSDIIGFNHKGVTIDIQNEPEKSELDSRTGLQKGKTKMMLQFLDGLAKRGYWVMVVVQFFAIIAGIEKLLGLPGILKYPLALVLSVIPVIGQFLGVLFGMRCWGLHPVVSGALFFWPILLYAIVRHMIVCNVRKQFEAMEQYLATRNPNQPHDNDDDLTSF